MFLPATAALASLCALLALTGACLHFVAATRLRRFLQNPFPALESSAPSSSEPPLAANPQSEIRNPKPPLTFWRALKVGVPALEEKLEALVTATRPEDQILLGADADSQELAACEQLRARHPAREITVVACEPGRALNPKISKYLQLAPHARHDAWLLTDSEAQLETSFVEGFRREWITRAVDILTAGYRFSGLRTWPQRLDAAPATLTLWPGLMLAPRIDFTLGACTGLSAAAVHSLGGWASLGDQLAEDRELGARLAAAGKTLALSRHVLTLEADDLAWWAYLKHQHRIAVTYRAATPLGTLGMPVLHVFGFAACAGLLAIVSWAATGAWLGLTLFAVVYLLRFRAAFAVAQLLEIGLVRLATLQFITPFVETFFWLIAWLPLPVWWAGKWRRVGWKGKLK
jgi:ceramide glucosyltransferase